MAKFSFKKETKYYKNYNNDWTSASQIIVCENGIFRKEKVNSICFIARKINEKEISLKDITFEKQGEAPITMEEKPYMIKKIPHKLIETILKFYQVYAKKNSEVKINIWYDKTNDKFFLDCPFQIVTCVTVREFAFDHPDIKWTDELMSEFPKKYELRNRIQNREIELVMETHSHHTMSCSFSGTDDNNDYFEAVGYGLSGVFITVLSNPRFLLRYFISNTLKWREKSHQTEEIDEVLFEEKDIIDYDSDFEEKYDFNEFARHVNIDMTKLFGETYMPVENDFIDTEDTETNENNGEGQTAFENFLKSITIAISNLKSR